MNNTIKVLDHGFVKLTNLAGPVRRPHQEFDANDTDPAQAARMSFESGIFGARGLQYTVEQDLKLAKYLWEHEHTSPFELVQVWFEVKLPIFVDRQLVRHRTWRRNESSGRYITLPSEYYVPERFGGKAADKKQGQADNLSDEINAKWRRKLTDQCSKSYELYLEALDDGVAPEHARMFLHLNHYVHWIGNVDLSNLFKFLAKRLGSGAQIEAQAYARAMLTLLRPHLPGLVGLFEQQTHA